MSTVYVPHMEILMFLFYFFLMFSMYLELIFKKKLRKCYTNTSYVVQNKSTPKPKLYIHTADIYMKLILFAK